MSDFNNEILLAIIAINMTIIGLTSIAESKRIVGVDYGKFLVKRYKIFGMIKMFHCLIIFAMINMFSLITMFINIESLRLVQFLVLCGSLVFAIYYFFSYILNENSRVKNQIYESEFIGMYYKDDTLPEFPADKVVGMNSGYRTNKTLSTNVISYFNVCNSETQILFKDIFGPNGFLYSRNKRIIKLYKKLGLVPYDYYNSRGYANISWEYFQLFRGTDLQTKWTLEILNLFNRENTNTDPETKLDNLIRVISHISLFYNDNSFFNYKILFHLFNNVIKVLEEQSDVINGSRIRIKESFCLAEFYKFIYTVFLVGYKEDIYDVCMDKCVVILGLNRNKAFLSSNDMFDLFYVNFPDKGNDVLKKFLTDLFNRYNVMLAKRVEDVISVDRVKGILKGRGDKQYGNGVEVDVLFG